MKIKDIPWYNRPGFKLTKKGVESLSDTELLSIIFWANDKEDDSLEISNKVLKNYKLHNIEHAGYKELVNLVCERSNAETVFHMIKRKFGAHLNSKSEMGQINEVFCKALSHNICVLIQEMFEIGINPEFIKCAKMEVVRCEA